VNRETQNCSGAIHRTDGMLKQVQHDNLTGRANFNTLNLLPSTTNREIVASSFNWTDKNARPSEDGRYEPEKRGIGRIIQALVVDGEGLDTVFITPNHLKRISVWLPENTYADGEIIIDISKIKGKRVVCSEIGLYEFPKETKTPMAGGPMGEETPIPSPFLFEKIFPNPTKNLLRIHFNSPDGRPIAIKLYDITGRLIQKEELGRARIGKNEFLLMPKNLSSGVYFVQLESNNYQKIEKVIYLK
ncbi:MAG: T9SS type A sorting domain-containing protein, partial [candidate division WOR-3 bacterium]